MGISGVTSRGKFIISDYVYYFFYLDGRVTAMMPHPERIILSATNTWDPVSRYGWKEYGAWFQMFVNARQWVG